MAHNLTSHPSTPAPNPRAFTPKGGETETRQCPEGQRFDPVTKTCVPIAERRPKDEGRVFRDVETGQVSGVTTVAGETFLGIDRKDVEKVLTQEAGRELPETARLKARTEAAEKEAALEERRELGGQFLEGRGFFEERRPEEVELRVPEREFLEKTPIIGPAVAAILDIFGGDSDRVRSALGLEDLQIGAVKDDLTVRELAITEIQKEVTQEGISSSEKFGALIESIPVIGPAVGKYAGNLIEDPKGNIDTILSEVNAMAQRATNMREKSAGGKMGDPYIAFSQIEQIQNDLERMEQRIQMLAIQSAILRADGDALSLIGEKILDAKQRAFDAKQSAASGIIAKSSDGNIFLELEKLKRG